MIKRFLLFGLITLAVSLFLYSCAPDELTGELVTNIKPTIYFTNLPINDSVYSYNATINWYSEDEDGQVMGYYYLVMLEEDIGGEVDSAFIANVIDTISIDQWISTEETEVTIQMYASAEEDSVLHQYIFVKCRDDNDTFSETIYYSLFRVNHLPETYLTLLPGVNIDSSFVLPVWSLPDTNSLWAGLAINWDGDDTLDFPEGSPDFQYEWKLFGPYGYSNYNFGDSTIGLSISDTTVDSLFAFSCADNDEGFMLVEDAEGNENCEDVWVWDTDITLVDLSTGCYIFTVRARDDALVPDTSSAWGTFIVIEPQWISQPDSVKDILIIQATQFVAGHIRGWPPIYAVYEGDSTYFPTEVMDFYRQMIDSAGDYTYDIYSEPVFGWQTPAHFPSISELASYRMVIIDDMDYRLVELDYQEDWPFISVLRNYLSVGGKAWVIGRQSFYESPEYNSGYKDFASNSLAFEYFDLSAGNYAEMSLTRTTAEFIGATSIYSGYGDLVVDSIKTAAYLNQYGLNKVEVLVRNSARSVSLYTYNAANPDTMQDFQYLPCAVKYYPQHQVFKTSYFSFPLYAMDNSGGQVQAVFTDMLAWFLEED